MPYTQTPMMMPMGAISSAPSMVAPMKIPGQAAPGMAVSPDAMQQLAKALMLAKSRRLLNTVPQGTAMSDAGSAAASPPLAPNLSGAAQGPMNA
nr:hypothetical protein [uncultured Rhodopila sp.]